MCPKSYWTNNSQRSITELPRCAAMEERRNQIGCCFLCFYSDWLRLKELWTSCWGQSLVWSKWSLRGDISNWLLNSTNSSDSQMKSTTPYNCSQTCSNISHSRMCWLLQNSRRWKLSSPEQRKKRGSPRKKHALSSLMNHSGCLEYLSKNIIIYFNDFLT